MSKKIGINLEKPLFLSSKKWGIQMKLKILELFKKCPNRRVLIIGGAILIIGNMVASIAISFNIPFYIYLELTGNPWQPITSDSYPEIGVETIDFVDSYHGWIAGLDGMIMVTKNGGRNWEWQHSGLEIDIQSIDFYNVNIGVAISKERHILITQDGGLTWILLEEVGALDNNTGMSLWDVEICNEETAYALGSSGTFFKINIPTFNWSYITRTSNYLYSFIMLNGTHGWATGAYGIIVHTTNGWQTYEVQDSGSLLNFHGIFFWNEHKGWVVGSDNAILATTDGGQHWRTQYTYKPFLSEYAPLLDVFFISECKGWAVGNRLLYTKNGGASWITIPDRVGPEQISFANDTHGWAVWFRKDRSYMTSVGGVLAINEDLMNLGTRFCITTGLGIPVILINLLIHQRNHKIPKKSQELVHQLCPACSMPIPAHVRFCNYCGVPLY
ncbi:MAG: hypothetical protein EAX86_13595 [Candidatus Heimdallarchaeota archaeon]|nr:hypothetical protein [Candidatus Heimdallarchaeota archaeon]